MAVLDLALHLTFLSLQCYINPAYLVDERSGISEPASTQSWNPKYTLAIHSDNFKNFK